MKVRMLQARLQKVVWKPTAVNVVLALLSVPIAYIFNNGTKNFRPEGVLILASLLLGGTTFAIKRIIPGQPKIFYGFALFAFTSVIDLLIPLEIDGFVTNFMDVYLKNGEPYLFSAWGTIVAYWDGTFNFVCYVLMGFYVTNGLPYRNLALFYSSNILNSMIVLLLGAFLSLTGLHWCTFLNIPYVLLPTYVLWTALTESPIQKSSVSLKPSLRLGVALLLGAAAVFSCVRGISSLGSRVALMSYYRDSVEPLINQKIPAPFAAVQGIVCLVYFAPAFIIMAFYVHRNAVRGWIKDLAIITSGAALQAEVSLLGMAWHPMTQAEHRLSSAAGVCSFLLHFAAHALTLGAPLLVAGMFFCPALARAGDQDAKDRNKGKEDKKEKKKEKKEKEEKKKGKKDKEEKKKNKEKKGKEEEKKEKKDKAEKKEKKENKDKEEKEEKKDKKDLEEKKEKVKEKKEKKDKKDLEGKKEKDKEEKKEKKGKKDLEGKKEKDKEEKKEKKDKKDLEGKKEKDKEEKKEKKDNGEKGTDKKEKIA